MKKKLSELAAELSVTEKRFDLVTVKNRKYYVYQYEGNLNGIENAVVLLRLFYLTIIYHFHNYFDSHFYYENVSKN